MKSIFLAAIVSTSSALLAADVRITVEAPATPRPISPYIYGVNQNPGGDLARFPMLRQGGNRMTAWNWETNASNAGADWNHQSDDYLGGGDTPGEVVRKHVANAMANRQAAVVTVPMAGYVSADKLGNGDVNQTPDYLNTRFHKSLPSKSKARGGSFVFPPDTTDRFVYQDEMVWWVEKTFGGPNRAAPIFYALCNEPDLWNHTHERIHPQKLTYAELISRTIDWSSAIKAVAPMSKVFGFVSFGYSGYSTLQAAPDANGRFFIDVFLQAMAAAEKDTGKRLVDVLALHWYPETRGGGIRITSPAGEGPAVGKDTALARVQAPRHMYDPTFRETSWIDTDVVRGPIYLIPTLQEKIAKNYPGTALAFTEYNYGGGEEISGAIAQADVLGAFGRHGIFAASWWSIGEKNPFIAAGFDAFLNYDGNGARFGQSSLDTTSSDITRVSAWAAQRTDGVVTLVLINRGETDAAVSLAGGALTGTSATRTFVLQEKTGPNWVSTTPGKLGELSLPAMSITVVEAGK